MSETTQTPILPIVEDFVHHVQEAMATAAQHNATLLNGAQEIAQEWIALAQEGMDRNLRLLTELTQARTLPDLADVQSRILHEVLEAVLTDSRRLASVAVRVAQETRAQGGELQSVAARAVRSSLAHAGEPRDYGADNA